MRFIRLLILFLLFTVLSDVYAQKSTSIQVVNFAQFESLLHKSTDTVYIINFWATWCVPCRKELPEFQKVHESTSDQNVQMLLVSLDFPKQIETGLIPYLESKEITAPVILLNDPNSNAWINKVDPAWTGALPATLVYKNQNRLFFEKELTYNLIIEAISKINN